MKRFKIVSFIILLALLLPSTLLAEKVEDSLLQEIEESLAHETLDDGMADLEELFNNWEMNGYPDYIGHVIYDNSVNKYAIGLVGASEADKNEIISKLSNPEIINFETATYSYNELLSVQNEIAGDSKEIEGIHSVGTGWTTINNEVTGFGKSGHEFRIVVSVDESIFDEYVEKYHAEYGDMVHLEVGSEIVPVEDNIGIAGDGVDNLQTTNDGQSKSKMSLYLTIFAISMFVVVGGFIINRNGLSLVKQSATGEDVTESRPLGKNEVIAAVKESEVKPRDSLYKDILDKIKK